MTNDGQPTGAERLAAFRDTVCNTFVPLEASTDAVDEFRGDIQTRPIGQVHVSSIEATRLLVRRTPRLIKAGDPEFYKLGLQLTGYSVVVQDGREAALTPGDFAVYDTTRPYQIAADEPHRMLVVMFPRKLLQVPTEQMVGLTARRVSGRQGLGAVVSPFLRGLAQQIPSPDPVVGVHLSDAVLDLLAASFAEQLEADGSIAPETRRNALLLTIRSFIEDRLDDPQLNVNAIAQAHHVSVSYLQKLFASDGQTVSGWIRNRRLERCRRDLADPRLEDTSVSAIGSRWSLTNPAHFSRLFKTTYGMTPSDYRIAASPVRGLQP